MLVALRGRVDSPDPKQCELSERKCVIHEVRQGLQFPASCRHYSFLQAAGTEEFLQGSSSNGCSLQCELSGRKCARYYSSLQAAGT